VLALAKEIRPELLTKSGLMLGLGETNDEVLAVVRDLRAHQCDILTLGQYLRPSLNELPVQRYLPPTEFAELREAALTLGFRHVESGPLVRSSYHAWEHVK
jgi:lipoyl synthase